MTQTKKAAAPAKTTKATKTKTTKAAKVTKAAKAVTSVVTKAATKAAAKAPSKARPAAKAPAGKAAAKPAKAAKPQKPAPAAAADTAKAAKPKLVRDSFTIPKSEYQLLDALKLRAAALKRPTKKSELLRAGIAALNAMADKPLLDALAKVPSLKTGRPKADGSTSKA